MSLWDRLKGGLSREQLVAEVRTRLARSGSPPHQYDAKKFSLRFEDGLEVSLHNAYDEYRAVAAAERDAVLDRFVMSIGEFRNPAPPTLDAVRDHLLPIVREQMFYENARLNRLLRKAPSAHTAFRSLGAHLTVSVAIDRPNSIVEVGAALLEEWKLDLEEALALARKNLEKKSDANFEETAPGLLRAAFQDEWNGSRAALPDRMKRLPVRGTPVALVLQRGVLYVTGSDDSRGLQKLAAVGANAHELPRRMSAFPVRLEGDAWADLALSESHEAAGAFEGLRYEWQARNYEEQRHLLAEVHGEAVFVTPFKVFKKPTGEIRSLSSLTLECDQLLPKTDLVSVVRVDAAGSGEVLSLLAWQHLAELLGSTLRADPDCAPRRFRVDGILSEAQVAEVRRRDLRRGAVG